jgi:hypothetical protein
MVLSNAVFFATGDIGEEGICGVELNGEASLGVRIEGVGDFFAIFVGGRAFMGENEAMTAVRLLAVEPPSLCAKSVRVGVPSPEYDTEIWGGVLGRDGVDHPGTPSV